MEKLKQIGIRIGYFLALIRWPGIVIGLLPAPAVAVLLGVFVSGSAALLWNIVFLAGSLAALVFLVRPVEIPEDMELRVVLRELGRAGEYTLPELAGQTGLKARTFEQKLEDAMALEIMTMAYYPPEQKIYIPEKGRDLHHCPRCAADFSGKSSGRCPNCKIRFSRVVLERPYRYS